MWPLLLPLTPIFSYRKSPCGNQPAGDTCDPAPINVWAQTGSYILIAISEIFASITGLEYAYSKAPKNMRSLVMSFFLFMSAIAAALGQAFNPLSTDPRLVWNYGSMAVLSFIGGICFWLCFRGLDKHEDELNTIRPGHVHGMEPDPVVVGSAVQVDH
jgi:POT family proton-dependent oligopeptide transporter